MAQPPFKTDVLQIEPGAAGTRTISRDTTAGELKFIDPSFPTGVRLADLMGLQSIPSVSIVGPSGGGAQFTTIQDAIDEITTTPAVVVIASGEYTEDIVLSKDVVLFGLGYVKITNSAAGPTIHITEDADDVPRFVRLQNLTIENTDAGEECIFVDGSNTFATGTVTVVTAPLAAGDVVNINGTPLTGVAAARTPGSNNFNASLGTTAALAAEIAAAITDTANSFDTLVTATALSSVVTLKAVTPGAGGNAITLSATTVPPGGLTVSGATLTGGGGLDSEVALEGVEILDCILLATGVGTRQIVTETVNNVRVSGGTWLGSSSTSEVILNQTASFVVEGVGWVNDFQVAYDTGNDQPSILTSAWSIGSTSRVGNLLINLIGEGSTTLFNCPSVKDITHNGDRTFTAVGCVMGNLLVEDTVVARFINCARGTLAGSGVTAVVSETSLVRSSALVAAGSDSVTFTRLQPNTSYAVAVDVPTAGVVANVTAKTTSGFTVTFSAPVTGTVFYTILRQM